MLSAEVVSEARERVPPRHRNTYEVVKMFYSRMVGIPKDGSLWYGGGRRMTCIETGDRIDHKDSAYVTSVRVNVKRTVTSI